MGMMFLTFLGSLIYTAYIWPALSALWSIAAGLLALSLFIFFIYTKYKQKKFRAPQLLFLGLALLAGVVSGLRMPTPLPAYEDEFKHSWYTNITVQISSFPQAIPDQDAPDGISYRLSLYPGASVISPHIGLLHPGQTVRLQGRCYTSLFHQRQYFKLYTAPAASIKNDTPPLPPELDDQISRLGSYLDPGIKILRDRYPWLIIISRLRMQASHLIQARTAPELRSLMFSMVLGNKFWLDYSTLESFRQGGISHVLALSGLHIGIISLCLIFLFSLFLSRPWVYGLSSLIILFYVIFSGMSPSILRAGFMFISYTGLKTLGYEPDWIGLLSFTALVILVINPAYLTDPGFLLSYSATLGIVLFSPRIRIFLEDLKLPSAIAGSLSLSFCATMATAPLIVSFFGGFSMVSLLTNLILLPLFFVLIPALMALFLTSVMGMQLHFLDRGLSFLWRIIQYLGELMTRPSWAYRELEPVSPLWATGIYLFFVILLFSRARISFRKNLPSELP